MRPDVWWRPRGRLARGPFFFRLAMILVGFFLLDPALHPLLGDATVWLLNPAALWLLACASAQRLHDRDRSAWWLLAGLVPVLGAVWLFVLFCRRGAVSGNRWGADPLRETGDFLVVG